MTVPEEAACIGTLSLQGSFEKRFSLPCESPAPDKSQGRILKQNKRLQSPSLNFLKPESEAPLPESQTGLPYKPIIHPINAIRPISPTNPIAYKHRSKQCPADSVQLAPRCSLECTTRILVPYTRVQGVKSPMLQLAHTLGC